jgi:hypothetical protein
MGVDHGRSDILVTKQLLDSANIVAIFEQMRGEAVPKGMATGRLGNSCFPDGKFDGVLKIFFANMGRRVSWDRGSIDSLVAGKTYCHAQARSALGYLRRNPNGKYTFP